MSSLKKGGHEGRWWRLLGSGAARRQSRERQACGVGGTLGRLCELIDGSSLPSGVIELVVQDGEPERHLLDVNGGRMAPMEPGSAVPWTSVHGTNAAWAMALGPDRDVSQLRHTGEPHLAEGLLEELKRRRLHAGGEGPCRSEEEPCCCSVPDCS